VVIREYKEEDLAEVTKLFYDTVLAINIEDYSHEQINVWATPDSNIWTRLKNSFAYVVELENTMVGFGSITSVGYLDFLYVHKDHQRKGIATLILDQLESVARHLGIIEIQSDVSIIARPFFESKGFRVVRSQIKERRGVMFQNYIMTKEVKE
jgi:putative acetyltransferase